jgi:eukaryotic-like serine/threonine-protein kinase
MKHVQDRLPDVQKLRPEISAALAAVIERATAKETRNRYATAAEMVHDLEQVLAIEAARAGETTGEATTVLRALPGETGDIAPVRLRRPRRVVLLAALAIGLAGGLIAFFATRTERGPGEAAIPNQGNLSRVALTSGAAEDYDPQGDQEESQNETQFAIDGIVTTAWDTETYSEGLSGVPSSSGGRKTGVGLYVEAPSPVAARRLDITTEEPGWTAEIYAARDEVPEEIEGWEPVSGRTRVDETERIRLDTARTEFRYYLVWIVDPLPDGKATINELELLR